MMERKSIFINTTGCSNGILSIIAKDIVSELVNRGIDCKSGPYADYAGQEIAYHMWWRGAEPYSEAEINSIFVTHIDDVLKEHDLIALKGKFDSFVTMSEEDAAYLKELGFDSSKVYGLTLPIRNNYVRPLSVGMFSNCYSDNRKNELWLLDYCKKESDSSLLNFVFIGDGWADFVRKLQDTGCSFEWHCVSRKMPYEYTFQQTKLAALDYYIYMGMDGGAMGSYDAYAQGIDLCISDDGYHKDIPDIMYKFESRDEFFSQFDKIISKQRNRIDFFSKNTVHNYVTKLISIWSGIAMNSTDNAQTRDIASHLFKSVKEKRRFNFFSIDYQRVRQTLTNYLYMFKEHKKSN